MNFHVKFSNLCLWCLALVGLTTTFASAQSFKNLHNFTGGTDGAYPVAGLAISGNLLFGTTVSGGSLNGPGTVFSLNTNGANFTGFDVFPDPGTYPQNTTNTTGFNPRAGLVVAGNKLYGVAASGGANGNGTVFSVLTNGTGYSLLHTMSGDPTISGITYASPDGANPSSTLILSGSTLYGVAANAGTNDGGTLFSVPAAGGSYVVLHALGDSGYSPMGGLAVSGGKLYGTTSSSYNDTKFGTIFSVNTDGTGFTNFYNFTNSALSTTPSGNLIISGSTLYGTSLGGGNAGEGTIFSIQTDGTGYTILHSFAALNNSTNADGASPAAGLLLSGTSLYGTTQNGGVNGSGTLFVISTGGAGFKTLYQFSPLDQETFTNADGANPSGELVLSGSTLFGTAQNGGWYGVGSVFSLSIVPATSSGLSIARLGTNVILTWPTNLSGYALQSTTNLASTATWNTVSPAPVIVGGEYTVTNSISPIRHFFRLNP